MRVDTSYLLILGVVFNISLGTICPQGVAQTIDSIGFLISADVHTGGQPSMNQSMWAIMTQVQNPTRIPSIMLTSSLMCDPFSSLRIGWSYHS